MNVYVPDFLVLCIFWALAGSVLLFSLAFLLVRIGQFITWVFRNRRLYWTILLFFTFKKYQDKIEKYNHEMMRLLASKLRQEKPDRLVEYADIFNYEANFIKK